MNSIEGLSNKEFSKMVQWFHSRRWSSGSMFRGLSSNSVSEGCPINYIGGLSNELYRRIVQ